MIGTIIIFTTASYIKIIIDIIVVVIMNTFSFRRDGPITGIGCF